jgi:hypothetical protein
MMTCVINKLSYSFFNKFFFFGGQKSFDMTHQLFIQHKGEFILMFNGRFDLYDPLREYPQGDVTTECKLV